MNKSSSKRSGRISRRDLVAGAGLVAAASIVPRHVLGGAQFVAPNEKINIGYVGCGTQGFRQMTAALENADVRIAAVCDPMRRSDEYPDYGNDELNNRMRKFLNDANWAKGARGALCGREVGQEIVNRYYSSKQRPAECKAYADVRELLAQEKDLDAVYIMTPDHLHGVIAIKALRAGKHVITHKPLANVLAEARLARDAAKESGLATHLFCAAGNTATPMICEWLATGVIGGVREVHNWSSRPFWPQGMTEPPGEAPVPEGFEWDLWLGPAAERAYHPAYTHSVFRGWYDFGTGALGDMGHYSFHQIFEMLKLGSPTSVEASRSQVWRIQNYGWRKQPTQHAYPHASHIAWEFPARGEMPAVTLNWYDGGLRPSTIPELEADGMEMPEEGMLLVGESGKMLAGFSGANPRMIPKAKMSAFTPPPQTLPRPIGELEQFVRACRGGEGSDASFEKAWPFVETILLGTIAQRVSRKLKWNAERGAFTNSAPANALLTRKNRAGWEV